MKNRVLDFRFFGNSLYWLQLVQFAVYKYDGAMAEWLRRGLQSLVLRFKSGWRLQTSLCFEQEAKRHSEKEMEVCPP